jgi:hypothetical protein
MSGNKWKGIAFETSTVQAGVVAVVQCRYLLCVGGSDIAFRASAIKIWMGTVIRQRDKVK